MFWNSADSLKAALMRLSERGRAKRFLDQLTSKEAERLVHDWPVWARQTQREPDGDWKNWLMMGGRGAGKTRSGAQWLEGIARSDPHYASRHGGQLALVGATFHDVKEVMIEGESGLLAVSPKSDRPDWVSSRRLLRWANGVTGHVFTANDPEGLRGNQFGAAWCDEIVKWFYARETWDMLQFCMRLGERPRTLVTTTPKPITLLKEMLQDAGTVVSRSATVDNAVNLSPGFIDHVERKYGGTTLGRQELGGELIADRDDGLWHRALLERLRRPRPQDLLRIIVAVDPATTGNRNSDACGIIAAGQDAAGNCHVLADCTLRNVGPREWAQKVVLLYEELEADLVLAETNQGGDLVKTVIHQISDAVPVRGAHATRSKWLRAEPVALLYEQGRVFHCGSMPELEDEMCALGRDGRSNGRSPDRLDALVWAITELALRPSQSPRVRRL